MFLHMQKYIPCTKHSFAYAKYIVLQMYMVLHAAALNTGQDSLGTSVNALKKKKLFFLFWSSRN